jgi:hypothetical protein
MKTKKSNHIITDEEVETAYGLVSEFFGSIKADSVYFELTHPVY